MKKLGISKIVEKRKIKIMVPLQPIILTEKKKSVDKIEN